MSALAGVGQAIAAEPAQSDAPAVSPVDRKPPLRLAAPRWPPLTGQQIKVLFGNRTLNMDEGYEPFPGVKVQMVEFGGCWPQERFLADGQWQRSECQRAARTFAGRWHTEPFRGGERLCVEAPGFEKRCRFVWQGDSANRVIMSYARFRSPESLEDPDWYNPYLLSSLSP